MEHIVLKSALLAVIGGVLFANAGCHSSAEPLANKRVISELNNVVDLIRPEGHGYIVVQLNGTKRTAIPTDGNAVSSFTPDLSGFSRITEVRAKNETLEQWASGQRVSRLEVQLRGLPLATVASGTWNGETLPHLTWAAPDGSRFFVLSQGVLELWSLCGSRLSRSELLQHVAAFGFSSNSLYWIQQDDKSILHWRDFGTAKTEGMHLASTFDRIIMAPVEGEVLLFRDDQRNSSVQREFVLANTDAGKVSTFSIPITDRIYELLPIKGTNSLILETTVGDQERPDGTELTRFVKWDYAAGSVTPLRGNEKMFQLHSTQNNVYTVQSDCRPAYSGAN